MNLELLGRPVPDPRGFLLRATDADAADRSVVFILPEQVAMRALAFDVAGADLLERAVLDRLPEIWTACLHAYRSKAVQAPSDPAPSVTLAEEDFRPR